VGVPNEDNGSVNRGTVYEFDSTTGSLLHEISNPRLGTDDFFGHSLAILGNDLLVGAYGARSVYLFDGTTRELKQTFSAPGAEEFGWSIAADDDLVLIGARRENRFAQGGAAHLFDASTGALIKTFLNPSPDDSDFFGASVAIREGTAIIGAWGDDDLGGQNAGAVYIFDVATGAITQTLTDPTPSAFDDFGEAIAIAHGRVIVGSTGDDVSGLDVGAAHLFDASTGQILQTYPNPNPTRFDQFGGEVAFVGELVAIGAGHADLGGFNMGAVYLFETVTGELVQTIMNPRANGGNASFGEALAPFGNRLIVGAPQDDLLTVNAGIVYVFPIVPEPSSMTSVFVMCLTLYVTKYRRLKPQFEKHCTAIAEGQAA
jgi:hypothetical protein